MKAILRLTAVLGLVGLGAMFIAPSTASAHERRTVAGDYTFIVGFLTEPAFEGQPNGIDLRVSHTGTDEPVEGVEKTLKAEVVVGGNILPLELRPRFRQPGAYNAEFVPTRSGGYTFRFNGTVESKPITETFESGPGRFDGDVEALTPLQFPDKVPAGVDLQRALAAAESRASTATTLGAVGVLAGLAGLALAVWALLRSRHTVPTLTTSAPSPSRPTRAAPPERL